MKFCFWGFYIAQSLKGNTGGGGELQIALLAKALTNAGHEVVVIDPYADESFVTEDGIKLLNVPNWNKGIKGIRLFWYRIPTLYRLFKEQKADYYYVRMRYFLNILPYLAARKAKGKFILALASDIDRLSFRGKYKFEYKANFNLFQYFTLHLPNDSVYKYLLKKADYVILQHSGQSEISAKVKGKKVLFSNIIDTGKLPVVNNPSGDFFIYVGSLTILKGADKLRKLLYSINKTNIISIVGLPNDNKSKLIYEQLGKMDNVYVKGRLGHNDTIRLIANAKALINTSDYEGFPNVFLEAWSMGIPVLSLKVNPGNIFDKFDLGKCFKGDLEKMKECIDRDETSGIDKNKLISYIRQFHDFNTAADRFLNILKNTE